MDRVPGASPTRIRRVDSGIHVKGTEPRAMPENDDRKERLSPDENRPVILVVDDNEAGRYATVKLLQTAGFRVIEAATGNGALQMALKLPDLILLDVGLPDKNGFEVCNALKSSENTSSIPIVYLSATYIDAHSKATGLTIGADGYLVQPVDSRELIATVNAMLRLRAAERKAIQALKERDETIKKLEEALAQVKILRGLLPVCAYCKKIRDNKGNWLQMETYIRERSEAEFSHGVCPECQKKAYQELDDLLNNQNK